MGVLVREMADADAEMDDERGEVLSFTVPETGIDRLDVWLTGPCEGFSRARIQGLMTAGRVKVNGAPASAGRRRPAPATS